MQFQTSIMISNVDNGKAEVYTVTFDCTLSRCTLRPLQKKDLTWSSPYTEGISEVKPVYYNDKKAVLMTTMNGVVLYDYATKRVLF